MTDKKIDFEMEKNEYDFSIVEYSMQEICQAIDALNERLDANTKGFISDIQKLTHSIIKINERLDKLENKGCDHVFCGSIMIGEPNWIQCRKCGFIKLLENLCETSRIK